jgi:copper homeostasis protein
MAKDFLIEAVVDSLDAALTAEAAGADRLELCSGLELGGLTPGAGLVASVCLAVQIPVHVLLRTRGGDFLCTDAEFETLLVEAEAARAMGAAGIVAGILLPNGCIDLERMRILVQAAAPMPVTFHRAFDRVADHQSSVAALLQTGCNRLLSSGFCGAASEGAAELRWLRERLGEKVVVMPGGGVTASNVAQIAEITGAKEFHFSAIQQVPSKMESFPKWMKGQLPLTWVPAPDKVAAIKTALTRYFDTKV